MPISSISWGRSSGIERLEQIAGIGLVQIADQIVQHRAVMVPDGIRDPVQKFGADRAGVVAEGIHVLVRNGMLRCRRLRVLPGHAFPTTRRPSTDANDAVGRL